MEKFTGGMKNRGDFVGLHFGETDKIKKHIK